MNHPIFVITLSDIIGLGVFAIAAVSFVIYLLVVKIKDYAAKRKEKAE